MQKANWAEKCDSGCANRRIGDAYSVPVLINTAQ